MRKMRGDMQQSPNRDNSVEKNLQMWEAMQKATAEVASSRRLLSRALARVADTRACV